MLSPFARSWATSVRPSPYPWLMHFVCFVASVPCAAVFPPSPTVPAPSAPVPLSCRTHSPPPPSSLLAPSAFFFRRAFPSQPTVRSAPALSWIACVDADFVSFHCCSYARLHQPCPLAANAAWIRRRMRRPLVTDGCNNDARRSRKGMKLSQQHRSRLPRH